jgi:hypothetical protein
MWIVVAGIILIALGWYARQRQTRVFIIGRETAQAARNEQEWGLLSHEPSPFRGKAYQRSRSAQGVFDPAPDPLDTEIRALLERFRNADSKERISDSLSMDDFYTMLEFARRAAVLGMRGRDASLVRDGLTAIAMIDQARIDYRDALVALSYLYHAASRIGVDGDAMMLDTAGQGGPGAPLIRQFAAGKAQHKDLKSSWMKDEVQTSHGVALIGWEGERYEPTRDFKPLLLKLAGFFAADKYDPKASVASAFPEVWFGGRAAAHRLKSLRAAGSVSAYMWTDGSSHSPYHLVLWVGETKDQREAVAIAELARSVPNRTHAVLAECSGNIVCVVVARSFVSGTPNIETDETLKRFSPQILDALHEHAVVGREQLFR